MGINDITMPCTPERVWSAIQSARAGGSTETTPEVQPHFVGGEANQDPGAGAEGETR